MYKENLNGASSVQLQKQKSFLKSQLPNLECGKKSSFLYNVFAFTIALSFSYYLFIISYCTTKPWTCTLNHLNNISYHTSDEIKLSLHWNLKCADANRVGVRIDKQVRLENSLHLELCLKLISETPHASFFPSPLWDTTSTCSLSYDRDTIS